MMKAKILYVGIRWPHHDDRSGYDHIVASQEDYVKEERGLAYQVSMGLISAHPLGYGVGFVEAYFSHIDIAIKGLGEGTDSVFSAPLDLTIIAGGLLRPSLC